MGFDDDENLIPPSPLVNSDSVILPISWHAVLGQPALDFMLTCLGVVPTADIRHTVALELNRRAPEWMKDVIHSTVSGVQHAN